MTDARSINPVSLGIASAVLAAIAFSINDMGIKFLSGDYPLHQVVLIRATVAIFLTLALIIPLKGG